MLDNVDDDETVEIIYSHMPAINLQSHNNNAMEELFIDVSSSFIAAFN
jgi:hypothetical protein